MHTPRPLCRAAAVLASTAAGAALGYGCLCAALPVLVQHLPAEAGPNGNGVGASVSVLMTVGGNIGPAFGLLIASGVLLIASVFGGLLVGVWLAGRIGEPAARA